MGRLHPRTWQWSTNQLVLAGALFLTLFANFAYFRNLHATFGGTPGGSLHTFSLGVALLCVTVLFLSLFSFRHLLKPAFTLLFLIAAVAAYFMDSYNVVIDREMILNVVSTDVAEARDLMAPKLALYLAGLFVLPSVLLWRVQIRPASVGRALSARLALMFAAVALLALQAFMFGNFYASFLREHKVLRYYANPVIPLYSAHKFASKRHSPEGGDIEALGLDANIPPGDINRELVIMVGGETARADRFSLNGYERETNPELKMKPVTSFTDVTACGTSTAVAVPCIFSLKEREKFKVEEARSQENVLDVLTHAGVNVLWRDNNSSSKGVAERITFKDFRVPELNPVCDPECRDVGMLTGLDDYIANHPYGDILIVLHQMGSHGPAYYKRYPEAFHVFEPTCDTNQLDDCSAAEIGNAYDNTIVYTDHFLARVIEFLGNYDDRFETAMLYVSDHGESLGESGVYLHGLPYWIAPYTQIKVPLIMWFGENFYDVDPAAVARLRDTALPPT
jgi:lipid A ethanolaminephosphotransferase